MASSTITAPTSWELAEAAVKSFDGSKPLTSNQHDALSRWKETRTTYIESRNGPLREEDFPEITKIFSDIFFREQLGTTSVLQVKWQYVPGCNGECTRATPSSPKVIHLSPSIADLDRYPRDFTLRVLLHEMTHAYLEDCQAGMNRCKGVRSTPRRLRSTKTPYSVDDPDFGVSGHGRAFFYTVKAIEENMERLLGFSGTLGRGDGLATEVRSIMKGYCSDGSLCEAEPLIEPLLAELAGSSHLVHKLLKHRDRSGLQSDRGIVRKLEALAMPSFQKETKVMARMVQRSRVRLLDSESHLERFDREVETLADVRVRTLGSWMEELERDLEGQIEGAAGGTGFDTSMSETSEHVLLDWTAFSRYDN